MRRAANDEPTRMAQRTIEGWVQLPTEEPGTSQGDAVVELRDASVLDAPSRVIASVQLTDVRLAAGQRLPFHLQAPDAPAASALLLRVQLQGKPNGAAGTGPLFLTTQAFPVEPSGDVRELVVAVEKVSG